MKNKMKTIALAGALGMTILLSAIAECVIFTE